MSAAPVNDAALNSSMRKLRTLHAACGGNTSAAGGSKSEAPGLSEAELAKMTPFQRSEYRIAERMRGMRAMMTELDEITSSGSANPTRKVEVSNSIRKEERKLRVEMQEARTAAIQEKKMDNFETLKTHFTKTQQLWRVRAGVGGRAGDMEDEIAAGGPSSSSPSAAAGPSYGATKLTSASGGGRESSIELENTLPKPGAYNLRDDEEFLLFFQQTHQNDQVIDKALDRIGEGVARLRETATTAAQELKVQSVLLDEAERKVDNVTSNLKNVNKRLKETIKKVDEDKMCMYVFCLLLVLALAGAIYYVISDNNKK